MEEVYYIVMGKGIMVVGELLKVENKILKI
jgi:mannose-6-phosphate isomerase-like protein (cupin superfamily)